ncbi:cytochrome P450 [Trametes polyzona]|nr:cytochrome P450 [Trametes polyzona]
MLQAVFVALTLHPHIQNKARAKLDAVVGPQRLPDFGDEDALVYVRALIKEALRWHIVVPLGVPHRTIADDVLPHTCWHHGHVEYLAYEDPDEFRPERFILDGTLNRKIQDPVWSRQKVP